MERFSAEWWRALTAGRSPPFIVTSLKPAEAAGRYLDEAIYCARGQMENGSRNASPTSCADRTSAVTVRAKQLRLWFASIAYVLLCALRRIGVAQTRFTRATCGTIRLKLLKISAQITRSARRIRVAMAPAHPWQYEFGLAHALLQNTLA